MLMIILQSNLKNALHGPVEALLEGAAADTWPAIRKLLKSETKTSLSKFSKALAGFEMDEDAKQNLLSTLECYAIDVVEGKAKEEAGKVIHSMKERYCACNIISLIQTRGGKYDSYICKWVDLGHVLFLIR